MSAPEVGKGALPGDVLVGRLDGRLEGRPAIPGLVSPSDRVRAHGPGWGRDSEEPSYRVAAVPRRRGFYGLQAWTGRMAVCPVETAADREALRRLLVEFHDWMVEHAGDGYQPAAELDDDLTALDEDTCDALLAAVDGDAAGCVLLFEPSATLAEFRRLWITPGARGHGLGRALVEHVIDAAAARGYEPLALTTPPWGETGHRLYESLGFERTPPSPETRLDERQYDEAIFMQLEFDNGSVADSRSLELGV